mmetsp:Transcript_3970/g.9577  ORF Transcript_3970/g.9577 Transcript_3970/m.9577 type:complete len:294 (+) Transcript_3970:236-1117(+)
MPSDKNGNGKNNRGRFGLGRAASSLRRSQSKTNKKANAVEGGKKTLSLMGRGRPQLSPLKDNVPNRPLSTNSSLSANPQRPQRQEQHVTFRDESIGGKEALHSSGFSQAEIHDLEESFKLFDIYGEGNVQVGDLRNILEVLRQEQHQQEKEPKQQSSTDASKFPHLTKLMSRLSELSDEDTLDIDDYIQLMASTTIANSIALENDDNDVGQHNGYHHFARVFELFDAGGKGYITVEDLERIAIELGEHDMTRGELQEMIDRACNGSDQSGSKVVGIEEFTKMMTMSLFPAQEA